MGLFFGIDASASGLTAERLRMDVISNNIANSNTTRTENGGAYHRRYVVFEDCRLGMKVKRLGRQMFFMSLYHFQFPVGFFAVNFPRQQVFKFHDRFSIVRRVHVCKIVGDDFLPNGRCRHCSRQVIKIARIENLFKHARFTHLSAISAQSQSEKFKIDCTL